MVLKNTVAKVVVFLIMSIVPFCSTPNKYEQELLGYRAFKNEQIKNPTTSPLSKEKRLHFIGLKYFDVDEKFKITAVFQPSKYPQYINLFEGEDQQQIHQLKGVVTFALNGKNFELQAYGSVSKKPNELFIPFKDLTNSHLTYGGGRYLETNYDSTNTCVLDFNYAYNPFCAYNEKYSCAIVPIENLITDSILAGEQNFLN